MSNLDAIETTVHAALAPLAASASGPFKYVGRWCGEVVERGGAVSLDNETLARPTSLLLEWAGERAENSFEGLEGGGDATETRGTVSLVAWSVVKDPRGPAQLTKGTTGAVGAMALVDAVVNRLNARQVESGGTSQLYRSTTIRYTGHRVLSVTDGHRHHVTRITFECVRSVGTAASSESTRDLGHLVADANNTSPPAPPAHTPENPQDQLDAAT